MIEFVTEDYHKDFINYCTNQLNEFSIKFHDISKEIKVITNILEDNYNLCVKNNVSYKTDFILEFRKKIKYTNDLSEEEQLFVINYNRLVDLVLECDNIVYLIKVYSVYIRMNDYMYSFIQRAINKQIQILLLKGTPFHLCRIGTIQIVRIPYDNTIPDWGRSYEFKKMLEDNGIQTKTKEHQDGKNWFVDNGLGREDFFILRWRKKYSTLRNKSPYRFKPSQHGNIYGKRIGNKPIPLNELFNLTSGLFDKIIHIYKYHYEYGRDRYPFINKFKSTT